MVYTKLTSRIHAQDEEADHRQDVPNQRGQVASEDRDVHGIFVEVAPNDEARDHEAPNGN